MRSEFAAQTSDAAAADPAGGDACPATSVRASFVSFERSAVLALSLLIAGSFALQSLVIAHGHVAGTVSGQAVAALVAVEAPSRPAPPVTVAGADASHSLLNVGVGLSRSLETSARAAAAEAVSEASAGLGLRTTTFGPEASKTPRIRTAMLGPAAIGSAPAPAREARADEHQEVIVIRPGGPRTLNLSNNRAAPAPAPQAAPQARVLGKATPGEAAGLVDKVHFQPHTPERCLPHDLLDVIYDVAERFGEVQILSTFRDPERNRRVGGAEQSFHLSCQAIDFRVSGKTAGLLSYLEGREEVGGLKRYPMGYFHIDNGPRRSW